MNKTELLSLLRNKKDNETIDLTGKNLEGIKSNLLNIEKNEIIFKPGQTAKSFFFVANGEVMLMEGDNISTFRDKEYFGFDELDSTMKRKHKAIGVLPSVLLEFIIHESPTTQSVENVGRISKSSSSNSAVTQSSDSISGIRNPNLEFEAHEQEGTLVIYVNIEQATLNKSKDFLNFVNKQINKGHNKLIVDLRKCTIIDSTFLGTLVKSLRSLKNSDGDIALVYDSKSQSTLFMITYMDKVFKTFNSVEEAVKELNNN
jgi:anti-sigma B factor antagonist